jgi:hypothetical protein
VRYARIALQALVARCFGQKSPHTSPMDAAQSAAHP